MLTFGICPICKKDLKPCERPLGLSRKEAMRAHLWVHERENLNDLLRELAKMDQAGALPESLVDKYKDVAAVELLTEEVERAFSSRLLHVIVDHPNMVDGVVGQIRSVDPAVILESHGEGNAFRIRTWMNPKDISALTGVAKVDLA